MEKEPRYYEQSGTKYISVTSILNTVIRRPGLENWLKYKYGPEADQESQRAIEIGKIIHEAIIGIETGAEFQISTGYPEQIQNCLRAYRDWIWWRHFQPLQFEVQVIDTDVGYGGKLDVIGEVDGVLNIIDWKTGRNIYKESYLQLAAYVGAWEKQTGQRIKQGRIIRLGKVGNFELGRDEKIIEDFSEHYKAFLHCLELYRWIERNETLQGGRNGQSKPEGSNTGLKFPAGF